MKRWYKTTDDCALSTSQLNLESIIAERATLYCHVPNPGENISISVEPFPLYESVPTEDEIKWTLQKIRSNRSGGPYWMRAEHLRKWLWDTQKAEEAVAAAYNKSEDTEANEVGMATGADVDTEEKDPLDL